MTGTNHYAAATSDLLSSSDCSSEDPLARYFLDRAQAHATLALVDLIREITTPLRPPGLTTVSLSEFAPAISSMAPTVGVVCTCAGLDALGNGTCAECGHSADLHQPHAGECTAVESRS